MIKNLSRPPFSPRKFGKTVSKVNNKTRKNISLEKEAKLEKLDMKPPLLMPVTPRMTMKGERTASIGRRLSLKG